VGGIQSYLWELWGRLDPESFSVLTASSDPGATVFDATQAAAGIRIERVPGRIVYFPTPAVIGRIREEVRRNGAGLVLFDPVLPLGMAGPRVGIPYGVILHGAEVAVPARIPVARRLLAHTLGHAAVIVSAGGYPAAEARRAVGGRLPPVIEVPPGVDCRRITPLDQAQRAGARHRLGLPVDGPLVVSVSRLVPRKGMDTLIEAAHRLRSSYPDLTVAIAGTGRDRDRLDRLAGLATGPVRLLGRISDDDKAALLGAADVFVMDCRTRWAGLEQEGFGIVFLEAAAAGVPQIAGRSGGAAEAVEDGLTGLVVERPGDPGVLEQALRTLLADPDLRRRMGHEARKRAEASFDYARLAPRLATALARVPI
jgi:phosphatidylinositol alpha-1,6-mannosyltransferase